MQRSWTTSGNELHLALRATGPRREALEQALRAAIRDRRLAAGSRLPSTRALAGDLGLARGTVVEAYAQLRAEGYLEGRRGSGTWVSELGPAAPPARLQACTSSRCRSTSAARAPSCSAPSTWTPPCSARRISTRSAPCCTHNAARRRSSGRARAAA